VSVQFDWPPPSIEEVDQFVADKRAYNWWIVCWHHRYGERWAVRGWIWRYADNNGLKRTNAARSGNIAIGSSMR
jgi:hypothetical protein